MKNLCLCFARPCRADALLRQVEIAQIGAEHRDSKGNLLPLSPDADLRLVTLAAQRIIERAWGKPRDYDPSEDKQAPSGFRAADYTTEELEQLQLILERGKEHEAAGGAAATDAAARSVAVELIPPEGEDERDRGRTIGVDRSRYAELFRLRCALDAHKT